MVAWEDTYCKVVIYLAAIGRQSSVKELPVAFAAGETDVVVGAGAGPAARVLILGPDGDKRAELHPRRGKGPAVLSPLPGDVPPLAHRGDDVGLLEVLGARPGVCVVREPGAGVSSRRALSI